MHGVVQHITFLYTADLPRTARFYEDVLELSLWLDQTTCRIYHVSGSAFIGFCQRDGIVPASQSVILTFVTDDVDDWYRRLVARGVTFEHPPRPNPRYAIYHCFFRDPNGYLLEIQRFLDPPPLP